MRLKFQDRFSTSLPVSFALRLTLALGTVFFLVRTEGQILHAGIEIEVYDSDEYEEEDWPLHDKQPEPAKNSKSNSNVVPFEPGPYEESARKSLGTNQFPWYDSATDELRPLESTSNPKDIKGRDSQYVAVQKDPKNDYTTPTSTTSSGSWDFWEVLNGFGWLLLVLILGALIAAAIYLIRTIRPAGSETFTAIKTETKKKEEPIERVDQLPTGIEKKGDWLTTVRDLASKGEYNLAIVYLYSYVLLQLDKKSFIQLTIGKTNRQYLREVSRRADLRSTFELIMIAFEDCFFGGRRTTRDRFDECMSRLPDFQKRLEVDA